MREILFRGKNIDNGEWVEGYVGCVFTHDNNRKPILRDFIAFDCLGWSTHVYVYDETIGQYTGSTDKNDKKIFEHDIVKAYKHNEEQFIFPITYKNGCFWFGNWNWIEFLNKFRNYEVIGNIHDNPELLKGGAE